MVPVGVRDSLQKLQNGYTPFGGVSLFAVTITNYSCTGEEVGSRIFASHG
jgi:hypothetical protein